MDAVQRMRKKAQDKGNLKSNEQQKVETKSVENKTVIVVEQANPQVVYVPTYTPTAGRFDLGVLEAETRESGLNPQANYVVARLKSRLFSESYIGVIGIDKESGSVLDPYNRAAGADANFIFFHKLGISGFWAKTFSSPLALQGSDWAATADVTYNSNLIQAEALRAVVQPNFNPELGFVERTDLVTNFVDLTFSPRPTTGPVREYKFEGFFRYRP